MLPCLIPDYLRSEVCEHGAVPNRQSSTVLTSALTSRRNRFEHSAVPIASNLWNPSKTGLPCQLGGDHARILYDPTIARYTRGDLC